MSTGQPDLLYGPVYGSLYFATIISTAFYGITCMQTFFYYVHYPNDPLSTKLLVAVMWSLDTIHEALTVSGAYKYIMSGLLDPLSFVNSNPELILLYVLTTLIAIPTQGYFVYRIYIFSEKNIVAPIIWVTLALVPLVSSIVYVAKALYSANGVHVVALSILQGNTTVTLASICFSIAAGIDVLIAMFMTFLLIRQRTIVSFSSTAHLLQRLTVFAVNTGAWTATFALLSVILLHVFPSSLIYAVFATPIGSVYCNTLLANLNARSYLLGHGDTFDTSSLRMATRNTTVKQDRHPTLNLNSSAHLGVWKTTEVIMLSDGNGTRPTTARDTYTNE